MNRPKRTTLSLAGLLAAGLLLGSSAGVRAADRTVVIENFTATWCQYCPLVAAAIQDLLEDYPEDIAAFQIHGADSYTTTWGNARLNFYGVSGYPTVWVDGMLSQVGAYSTVGANYSAILNMVNQRLATSTDVTVDLQGVVGSGNLYDVAATVSVDAGGSPRTVKVHIVQVLNGYPSGSQYYNCLIQANNAPTVQLDPGEEVTIPHTFTLSGASAADTEDVKFIAWAQVTNSSGPANIYNAAVHVYGETPHEPVTITVGQGKGYDYQTISDAIDASWMGDTIAVAPGTYAEAIDYAGKGITVLGTGGAETTIIDAQHLDNVVRMWAGEGPGSVLEGFTITGGQAALGGGLLTNGTPTVRACLFADNTAQYGGGIYVPNGTKGPLMIDTSFCGNQPDHITGPWQDGGGNSFEDSCEGTTCTGDVNADAVVDVSDILAVIAAWGPCKGCPEDIDESGVVNVTDLLSVIAAWGPCP